MSNPLLGAWNTPHGIPPFAQIQAQHFPQALDAAMTEQLAALDAICNSQADDPSFANTIGAFDAADALLRRTEHVLSNLGSSLTTPELQAVEREYAPKLAAHESLVYMNAALFARVKSLYTERASLNLRPEELQLVERVYKDFVRKGAALSQAAKGRYAAIVEELAGLTTQFSQNVLADENGYQLVLTTEEDLAGLPAFLRDAAKAAAQERGVDGYVITLSRSLVVPFLTHSSRRDLREIAYKAWTLRGENPGPTDNRALIATILKLRQEQAQIHGYASFAAYATADAMALTPEAVQGLLGKVWPRAKQSAALEAQAIGAAMKAHGSDEELAAWDWRYYAEKVRVARYSFDDSAVKPYFSLERMTQAMFDCAGKLFGLRFMATQLASYHADVRVYEAYRGDALVGIFMADNFARPGKRSGAWMSYFRMQSRAHGQSLPIILNNNNFNKPAAGEPTLLSFDDARTLFHEFGHGLHGLLSNVSFNRLSGTSVLRDFVELPSQLYEHWLSEPVVLQAHARHYQTGEPIPQELLDKMLAARTFQQGFDTIEYTSSALVDQMLHSADASAGIDISEFEAKALAQLGMPKAIGMRHRLPHFSHLFAGDYYAAGYYVYMWAEVLDADAFEAFTERQNPFDAQTAAKLYRFIYSSGGTLEPNAAFRAFRGRDPVVEPMLKKRGLIPA